MATQKAKTTAARKDAVKQIESAVNAGKETVENMVKAGTETATQNVEKAVKMTQEQVEKANTKAFKTIDEVYAYNKGNVDAFIAAGSIYLKGVEAINKELFAYAQKSVETGLANAKTALTVKSVNDLVELNNDFAKHAIDNAMAESTKLSEMGTKVANDAVKPLSDRFQVTVEKFVKPAA